MTDGRSYEDEEEFGLVYQDENKEELSELPEEKIVSIEDGFWLTRNRYGYLNLDYWASLTGYTVDQLLTLAKGKLIWRDPARFELSGGDKYAGWLPKEQFLMGNRIKKLKDAERLNISYGIFEEEIRLLKENLPDEVSGEDIHVNLGSTWVLSVDGFIAGFIAELLEMRTVPKVIYDTYRGRWSIESNDEPNYVLNNYTYGTVFMSALRIIEHKLNARPLKVYDQVPRLDGRGNDSVLNQADTLAAQEKGKLIDARFQDYCHGNKRNEELLQEAFMNQYGYGLCEFDGSHFNFKDISGKISMFKNQKDAVAHALASPNVLFADKVGSGKTIEYACSVHELLRMGLVKKALIVVPNTTLDAVYKVYTDLFPMDSVLLVRPGKEFSAARRKDTLAKMKTAGYQVIFMAYSSFDMITMTKEYAFAKKDRELRQCRIQMENAPTYQQKRKLENVFRRMQKSAKKYRQEFINSETACFDELGFDMIVVDEAHNYKNISLEYRGDNIVGFHAVGSKKADNMLEKVQYIQKQRGRVIFATGTPITNSLADLYVLQRYLQPEELKICNIYHFNDWINTFCEEETAFEIDVDSKNCRFTTRFSRFHNLTELMCMFSEVCHFYQGSAEELGLPEFNGYSNVTVKRSKEQKAYIDALAERTEAIRNHEVDRSEDNLLKITVNGRQAATDIRLVCPDADVSSSETKIRVCARNMARMYFGFPGKTQIAFSDISTPKVGFNIYDELKKELVKLGVKEAQIMFIHDADSEKRRAKAEKDFNDGKIRILIGSTQKLGTGTNVQERLIAVHHVDVPWKPADMIQREGRLLRQGNTCEEVFVFRYITECSFDAYTYQILENKQRFIAQFLSGSLTAVHRDESDCADTVLTYAEVKALAIGNPLIKKRVEVSNELEHARINQRQKKKELISLEEILFHMPARLAGKRLLIANVQSDIRYYQKHKESVKREERLSFGEELLLALKENVMQEKERYFSGYQGFDVILPRHMEVDKPYVWLKRKGSNQYSVAMNTDKVLGVCQRLDYLLDNLQKEMNRHNNKLRALLKQQNQAKSDIALGNMYDEEVKVLADKLKEIDEKLKEGKAI